MNGKFDVKKTKIIEKLLWGSFSSKSDFSNHNGLVWDCQMAVNKSKQSKQEGKMA